MQEPAVSPQSANKTSDTHDHPAVLMGSGAIAQGERAVAAGEGGTAIGGDQIIVQHPSALLKAWEGTAHLLHDHWQLILPCALLEMALLLLFLQLRPRFLVPVWLYELLAVLLLVVGGLWYAIQKRRLRHRPFALVAALATMLWIGLFGWQLKQIVVPARFRPEQFGIALATLGEGPDFRMTRRTRELAGFLADSIEYDINNSSDLKGKVVKRLVGVVRSVDEGRIAGQRIGADLVLWGQVLEQADGAVIYYQLLETPDLTDDPLNPMIIPVLPPTISIRVPITDPSPLASSEIVKAQIKGLTAFGIGLFYYVSEIKPGQAEKQFETAQASLAASVDSGNLTPEEANLGLIYYYLGKCKQLLGKYDDSQAWLLRAAEINPDDPAIYLGQFYNYRSLGNLDQATESLNRVIDLTDQSSQADNIAALYDSAVAYEEMGDEKAALQKYETLRALRPDFFIGYLSAARLHVSLGQIDEAEKLYQQARVLAGADRSRQAWVRLGEAVLAERARRPTEAISAFGEAIDLNPDLVTAHFLLAAAYTDQEMYGEAEQEYQAVLGLSDNPVWAHDAYGQFLLDRGEYAKAIKAFKSALSNPNAGAAMIHARLGLAYAASDPPLFVKAKEEFKTALQANPGNDEAYIHGTYGNTLYQFQHYDEAIAEYEQALRVSNAPQVETRLNLANLYMEKELYSQARDMYQSVLAMGADVPPDLRATAEQGMHEAEENIRSSQELGS